MSGTIDGMYICQSKICFYVDALGTGEQLVVRSCSLDSGSTTADTEIVRISNCGAFQFEDQLVQKLEF